MPRLSNINWSPPFQGPFVLDRGTKAAGQALAAYHRAAKLFTTLVNSSANEFSYLLQPGQCVIFNNRRVLHGRQKFQSGSGERWLKGAYLDMVCCVVLCCVVL
jgi:gamma-butyrobetaine dioxygenase